jgi:hypothetical protein
MNEWPVDQELDEKLRRVVNAEVAAADPRQIRMRRETRGRSAWPSAGLAIVAVVAIVAALVGHARMLPATGGPSETPTAATSAGASELPGESPTAQPTAEPTVPTRAPTPGPATGPTHNPSIKAAKTMTCPRYRGVAVALADGKVLVAGGCLAGPDVAIPFGSAEIYDPSTGKFSPTGTMVAQRDMEAAVLLKDGRVFFVGGQNLNQTGDQPETPSGEIYDPATGLFSPVGPVVKERNNPSAVVLNDGRVLILGGDTDLSATAEIFDPATGTFKAAGKLAIGTCGPSTLLPDGRVLILAIDPGFDLGSGPSDSPLSDLAQIYDPATDKFTRTGSMVVARDQAAIPVRMAGGRVLVVGDDANGTAEVFNYVTDAFGRVAPMASPMYAMSSTALSDGRVLVLGTVIGEKQPQYGSISRPSGNVLLDLRRAGGSGRMPAYMTGPYIVTGELYDPATNHWTVLGHLNVQRSEWTATLLRDGRVLIAGGGGDTAEFFDPKTRKFTLNR